MSCTLQDQKSPRSLPFTPQKAPRVAQRLFVTESTPVVKKYGPDLPYASRPKTFKQVRSCLAKEMEDHWLGAMPVDTFLQKYLPPAETSFTGLLKHPFKSVPRSGIERSFYKKFISVISKWMPNLLAVDTSSKTDTSNVVNLKPDVSIYNRIKGRTPQDKSDFSQMELWIEFKANRTGAAFQDPPNTPAPKEFIEKRNFTPATEAGKDARGQLAHYAGAHHSLQFRHFSFSIVIQGDEARFLRWNPSGTVVTAAFNYRKNPSLMAEFFWRFNHLNAEQRGHDVSVQPADLTPELDARVREELNIKDEKTLLYRYEIPGTLLGQGYAYGPRPPTENRSLVSRCTRTLPVYWIPNNNVTRDTPSCDESESPSRRDKDQHTAEEKEKMRRWSNKRRIYMKDTWRFLSNSPGTAGIPEHEIYDVLYKHATPNIPEDVTGGDVKDGGTQTEELLNTANEWLCVEPRVSQYQHYRLVQGNIGRPLFQFKSTKQLVTAVLDALEAHTHAFDHANLLHRDISAGNIILTDEGRGLLIDWELAKFVDEGGSRRPDRTGTWQFMSVNLLQNPDKVQGVTDDLESFLHVLAWTMLRFLPAHADYQDRAFDLARFDEQREPAKNKPKRDAESGNAAHLYPRGGYQKRDAFRGDYYPSESFEPQTTTPLTGLLRKLSSPFKSLYTRWPPTAEQRKEVNVPHDLLDRRLNRLCDTIEQYDDDIGCLRSSTWFIDIMKTALDGPEWSDSDGAQENLVTDFPCATSRQAEIRTSQLLRSQNLWERSKTLPGGSKRTASPTPESSSSKRHRGTPVMSGTRV